MPSEPQPKILIADDHFLIRQFVKRTLVDSGIENIDLVNDGNEAIDFINASIEKKDLYDIVFLDWNMPILSGIDVLSYIRTKSQYQNAAIVMFTAESEKQNIMKAIKMGATSYILKPIAPMELNKKIREIMDWLASRRMAKV
ncbi:MAG: response regulator [Alphaproteobacteria bacterium]|nr:response regulator [Alphaproteobacteria bacterium]